MNEESIAAAVSTATGHGLQGGGASLSDVPVQPSIELDEEALSAYDYTDNTFVVDVEMRATDDEQSRSRQEQQHCTTSAVATDALVFSTRMAVTMALGCLLVILPPMLGDTEWPEATWIYVTAGVVSWQAGPDTAPVFKKLVERIIGTLCGACLGLVLGFLSIVTADSFADGDGDAYMRAQAFFLFFTLPLVVFLGSYWVTQAGHRNSYVSTLTNLTTGLVVLAFYGTEDDTSDGRPPWMHGLYRVFNILIGCAIAGLVTSLVRPVPTYRRTEKQVEMLSALTGESVRALMDATIAVSEQKNKTRDTKKSDDPDSVSDEDYQPILPTITQIVRHPELIVSDQAHDLYIACVDLWRDSRQSLQLLRYDPAFLSTFDKMEQVQFREHVRLRLARLFRIQVAVVMMDSLLRGGLVNGDSERHNLQVLRTIGNRIEELLNPCTSIERCNELALALIQEDMVEIGRHLRELDSQTHCPNKTAPEFLPTHPNGETTTGTSDASEELWSILGTMNQSFPLSGLEGPGHASLFYRLLEHVILKVVRLHRVNQVFVEESSPRA